ncbi:uncharacterized protein DUF4214 [Sphingomonas sp. BK036]|uniref:DUF4214 domain-containing protein n=1 Tax=Sphingomonas sp. BK036 TaxID=2512122 RepID=UPI001028BF82|nr:DUF4214 domain-containing protein [Sphingomonas sp. BK036]RZT44880.1 uncharacterized protein DUF4214 [Sphingomonas sp. BK036]
MTKYTISVSDGTQKTTRTLQGSDRLEISRSAILSVNGTAIKWAAPITDIRIDNQGIIESSAKSGRAIDLNTQNFDVVRLTINNLEGGIIRSSNDAFRISTPLTNASIYLNNAGRITSTTDGQAIDFDSITARPTSGGGIVISNLASGVIEAIGADAIRPGNGTVIHNAGRIVSGGIIGDKNDAVDWQGKSGEVNNLAGGVISGQRHGITSDVYVTVFNDAGASITGRNGSGVGSDGGGMVINYGRITGNYVGVGSGDGDGVDIDGYGHVDNYGIIEGIAAGGADNGAEGVLVTGGGVINNYAGAVITGVVRGVTVGLGTVVNNYASITATGLDTTDASDGIGGFGGMTVNNFLGGTISGNMRGIFAGGGLMLSNAGQIYGGDQGVLLLGTDVNEITNSGIIQAKFSAVQAQGGTNSIVNSGTLYADRFGILLEGGGNTIDLKAGSVTRGTDAAIYALGISDNTIFNAGEIDGTIYLNDGIDKVTNNGLIKGTILLRGGDDIYTLGTDGLALGTVDGGAGRDTLDVSALAKGVHVMLDGVTTGTPDVLYALSIEAVLGSGYDDVYALGAASLALGIINGGAGRDTLDLSALSIGAHVVLDGASTGIAGTLTTLNVETILGSSFNDIYALGAARLALGVIDGGAGRDTLDLSALTKGAHVVLDGATTGTPDALTAFNVETIVGSNYDDIYTLGGANLTLGNIDGGAGRDTLDLSALTYGAHLVLDGVIIGMPDVPTALNVETVLGSSFDDTYILSAASLALGIIDGRAGRDTLDLSALIKGAHVVLGGATTGTPDALTALSVETVLGSSYDDIYTLGAASLALGIIDGGTGRDTLDLSALSSGAHVVLDGAATGTADAMTALSVETVLGSSYDDTYALGAASLGLGIVDGGAGRDALDLSALTRGAHVVLDGPATGTPDTLTALNIETIRGSDYDDIYTLDAASASVGIVDGAAGRDTLDLSALTKGTHVVLDGATSGTPDALTALNVETVLGSSYDDIYALGATSLALGVIDGRGGHDTLDLSALTKGAHVMLDGAASGAPDILTALNVESILGSSYDDTYTLSVASLALGIMDGGTGRDTLDLSALTRGVHAYADSQASHEPGAIVAPNFETIVGTKYDDVFAMTSNRSGMLIEGGGGNDIFLGGRGNDIFHGGAGLDQAVYSKFFKDTAALSVNNEITITSSYGSDKYFETEHVNFKDGYFTGDIDDAAARVARVYLGVLNRTPDAIELRLGVRSLEGGGAGDTIVSRLSTDHDTLGLYSAMSNQDFVEKLYSRFFLVIGEDMQDSYLHRLDSGDSRSSVASQFFDSADFKGLTATITESGSFIANDAARMIYSFYHAAFGRLPESGGFEFWTGKLERGELTYRQVSDAFTASAEWKGHVAGLNSGELVEFVYTNVLGRHSDEGGHAFWTSAVDNGLSEAALMRGFANSAEHQQIMTGIMHDGMVFKTNDFESMLVPHIA